MQPNSIYAKTAKGILEVKNKTIKLSRELGLVFLAVDGKTPLGELGARAQLDTEALAAAMEKLVADGYIKLVAAQPAASSGDDELDLDFTSPAKVAKLNQEAEERAKAENAAKAQAEASARAAAEAKARQAAQAREHAAAEGKAREEAAAKLKAEEAARAAAQASAKAQLDAKNATEAKAKNSGLAEYLDKVLSADTVKSLKPAKEVYEMAAQSFGVEMQEIRLIAAHTWDIAGALQAGCKAAFVARPGMVLDPLAASPDVIGTDLKEVVNQLIGN